MSYKAIIADIKKKDFKAVYFLHGPESYFIDVITAAIEQYALAEHEKAFNQTVVYGRDVDHLQVIDAARRYPMMAERQLVVLKEAQEMKSLKELQAYIENPTPTTVLLICHKHKKYRLNTKLGKALKANALVFEAKALYDNQVPAWIVDYLKTKKLSCSPAASELLAEYLGTKLDKVANELDKLALNLEAGTEVTPKAIETHIGISKDYNVFELQKALGAKDVLKCNRIVKSFIANPRKHPIQAVIGSLYNYFSKIYQYHAVAKQSEAEVLKALGLRSAYFLRDYRQAARYYPFQTTTGIIHLLREFDLKSKGLGYNATGKPDGELLKEMIWRILHL